MNDDPSQSPVRAGDVLAGKYRVEHVLGVGGMGVVVAARHLHLQGRVAIKFLLDHTLNTPGLVARFLREAQAATTITSEHVTRVIDVGTLENGAPYMVMEYLEGQDLEKILSQSGPLPVARAVDFVLQGMEALAEAHAAGIVHRDLKPGNLFLAHRADGSPLIKVLDFGISKAAATEGPGANLTSTQNILGSPLYMSPEQVRSSKYVDARSDIWSLGVILYELLTGTVPFNGDSAGAVLASVIADTPVPVSRLRAEVPAALEQAILRCLQKAPDQRFASVAELALALAPFASAEAALSATRINRVMHRQAGTAAQGTATDAPATSASPTAGAWANTNATQTATTVRKPMALVAVVVASAAVISIALTVGAVVLLRGGSHVSSAAGSQSAPDSTSAASPATSAPEAGSEQSAAAAKPDAPDAAAPAASSVAGPGDSASGQKKRGAVASPPRGTPKSGGNSNVESMIEDRQ